MIDITKKEDCCGCNACGDICPTKAITFTVDKEGFWYPVVNETKCIHCDLCSKICPCISRCKALDENDEQPTCYVAEHRSIEVIFQSTTGGMFSALADAMYNENGYVGGAVHNEDFSVSHYISNNRADLQRLRRSKDLQSNAEGFYREVKRILDEGGKVLACGLPCQIAGLLNFLRKDYENLITVDLLCAGVNSPKVWRKYLDYIEEMAESKIIWTENKSKEYGWHNLTQKFIFENGEEYFDTRKTSLFTQGYIESHLYCRPSCYECRFKGFPRAADISIGDFWGIEKYSKDHQSNLGTSLLLINSEKGKAFFNKAKRRVHCKEVPLEWALEGNPALEKSITRLSDKREEFFEDLDHYRFNEVVQKYSINTTGNRINQIKNIKAFLRMVYKILKITHLNPKSLYQTIRYSGVGNLLQGKGIICGTNCHINIEESAELQFEGILILGRKDKFPHSHQESKLFLGKNAKFNILGNFEIDAGSELVVFEDAELIIHGGKIGDSDANAGLTVICGKKIEIMHDVGIGRNVTIRDTNGASHFMNTTGYRPSRPVTIGEKAWLCEACTIMPGVKVGRSAIVGACSLVTSSVPDHALVSGNPASIVKENVLWKW